MSTEKMFEAAVRNKFRFPFRGIATVEDLWDLTPENLDTIFKSLNATKKKVSEESLLGAKTQADEDLLMKIEIIKYIVGVKIEESTKAKLSAENARKRQEIMGIIAEKDSQDLRNMSKDELAAMLKEIG